MARARSVGRSVEDATGPAWPGAADNHLRHASPLLSSLSSPYLFCPSRVPQHNGRRVARSHLWPGDRVRATRGPIFCQAPNTACDESERDGEERLFPQNIFSHNLMPYPTVSVRVRPSVVVRSSLEQPARPDGHGRPRTDGLPFRSLSSSPPRRSPLPPLALVRSCPWCWSVHILSQY